MKLPKLMNKIAALLLLSCLFACAEDPLADAAKQTTRNAELPYYAEATFTPYWLEDGADTLQEFHRISPFSLIDQRGDTITEQSLDGKIYVADFFFTACPGICPKMTSNMAILQEAFKYEPNVKLLSHSVTPRYDSVSVLQAYAEAKGVDANKWHLLTGDRDLIYSLGRKDYFVEEDLGLAKDPDDFLHTENFVLIDRNRHIRGIYNGLNRTAVNQLAADIKTLLKQP